MNTRRRNIVITGVTRGLGRSLVAGFIEAGHRVTGCGRSQSLIDELAAENGPDSSFECVDVSDDSQVGRWATSVINGSGPPDLLINNAAIVNTNANLWEVGASEFDRVIDVNIKGVTHVIRHFAPAMIAAGGGVIVNLSSGWGRSTAPQVAPYCATKWAIEGLSKSLAQELPAGMASIPLNPGIIDTDMLRSCFGAGAGDYPTADDWAKRAVPFLLSLGPQHNGESMTVE